MMQALRDPSPGERAHAVNRAWKSLPLAKQRVFGSFASFCEWRDEVTATTFGRYPHLVAEFVSFDAYSAYYRSRRR